MTNELVMLFYNEDLDVGAEIDPFFQECAMFTAFPVWPRKMHPHSNPRSRLLMLNVDLTNINLVVRYITRQGTIIQECRFQSLDEYFGRIQTTKLSIVNGYTYHQ